jgi:hypothetical protein
MTTLLHTYHLSVSDDHAERDDLYAELHRALRHHADWQLRHKSYGHWELRTAMSAAEVREALPLEFEVALATS